MPTIAELADAYRVLQAKQTELDQRLTALPIDDIEGRDALMAELGPVVTDLHETVRQLSRARAHDVAALRSKAASSSARQTGYRSPSRASSIARL